MLTYMYNNYTCIYPVVLLLHFRDIRVLTEDKSLDATGNHSCIIHLYYKTIPTTYVHVLYIYFVTFMISSTFMYLARQCYYPLRFTYLFNNIHIPSPLLSSNTHTPFSEPTPFITHTGPNCYVKPSAKSNCNRNALCHVCLAGDVNVPAKQRALSVCCIL